MKLNSMVLATVAAIFVLFLLIAWSFYSMLQTRPYQVDTTPKPPPKAVMAQVDAINQVRLQELADQGKVVPGMSKALVRTALGDPERIEQASQNESQVTIWWYQHDGWKSVVFTSEGLVSRISVSP